MKSKTILFGVSLLAAIVLASSIQSLAQAQKLRSVPTPAVSSIASFDAPGAGAGPGGSFCFAACPGTVAESANTSGAVTGYYVDDSNVYHGFVRQADGTIQTFDAPNAGSISGSGQGTLPYAINSSGAIAGQYQDASFIFHGFVRSPAGVITSFDIPGFHAGAFQGPGGSANINSSGEVAGFYIDANSVEHGFVRQHNGVVETFDVPGSSMLPNFSPQGTVVSLESGLNDAGEVTGWYFDSNHATHGYVRSADGTFTTFDNLDAGSGMFQGTYAGAINSLGVITGAALDSNYIFHGFVRGSDGTTTNFDAPRAGSTMDTEQGTFAVGINSAGVITAYVTDNRNVTHGAVRNPNGTISLFNVIGAGAGPGQGTIPQSINSTGAIPGYWTDSENVNHGFIRIP